MSKRSESKIFTPTSPSTVMLEIFLIFAMDCLSVKRNIRGKSFLMVGLCAIFLSRDNF